MQFNHKAMRMGLALSAATGSLLSSIPAELHAAPEWKDLKVLSVNREKARATMMVYPDKQSALAYDRTKSPFFQSLNGDWKFNWSYKPADRPADFHKEDFDSSAWKTIPVPSNWQMHGYDVSIYQNRGYNFKPRPPEVPTDWNPVGSYLSSFEVPTGWNGRDVFLVFDGVDSAFYVWINGKKVGYSEDSRLTAEFNITDYLREGSNSIAVEVYRWSTGSYLEDQDKWRLSGIMRDVYLWSTPKTHIRDFTVVTELDEDYEHAVLKLDAEIVNPKGELHASLLDASGNTVAQAKASSRSEVALEMPIKSPAKWTPETPNLYTLLLAITEGGKTTEIIPQRVGFRRTEIKDGIFLLNGQAVIFRGANRHDHHPDTGHTVTREDMLLDIQRLKEFNFNSVRTAHEPNAPLWYDLCDEYGIMLWDEANLESHGMGYGANSLAKRDGWKEMHVERVVRMIERDKNHASVVTWSLGNESGDGVNIKAAYDHAREKDPTRPVHYERSKENVNTDIMSHMYMPPYLVKERSKPGKATKPFIICEYMHSMGNSTGGAPAYWDIFYADNHAQGGFVWDWMDQGLRTPVPDEFKKNIGEGPVKKTFFAYGGFFEDAHPNKPNNQGNFCMNGIMHTSMSPNPGAYALKYLQRYPHVSAVDLKQGVFKIKNWHDFVSLDQSVTGRWWIEANGEKIAEGELKDLAIPAREEKKFTINLPDLPNKPGVEYFISFGFYAVDDYHPLVEGGHLLAWDQFQLPGGKAIAATPVSGSVEIVDHDDNMVITGDGFEITFDRQTGTLSSYKKGGQAVIENGGNLFLERAMVDNERGQTSRKPEHEQRSKAWLDAGKNATVQGFEVEAIEGGARITISKLVPDVRAGFASVYTVFANGEIVVEAAFNFDETPDFMMAPHYLCMEWQMPDTYQNIQWFGMAGETYSDRNFELIGLNEGTVDSQWTDYSRPQENGNKTEVRWLMLSDDAGNGVLLRNEGSFLDAGAFNYSISEMFNADYSFQMERSPNVLLNVIAAQEGLGGISSWGNKPMKEFRLNERTYEYVYRIQPVSTGDLTKALQSKSALTPTNVAALAKPDPTLLPELVAPVAPEKKN